MNSKEAEWTKPSCFQLNKNILSSPSTQHLMKHGSPSLLSSFGTLMFSITLKLHSYCLQKSSFISHLPHFELEKCLNLHLSLLFRFFCFFGVFLGIILFSCQLSTHFWATCHTITLITMRLISLRDHLLIKMTCSIYLQY